MKRGSSLYLLFLYTLSCAVSLSHARNRSLTEITYHFTTCGSSGVSGPQISDCESHYRQVNSPIVDKLFEFEGNRYDGAQGFRLPRDDLYNITVAGASGGEGVYNFEYGFGGVVSAQVRLTTDYEYLIMVGHKGTSVCDAPENAAHPVCQESRPWKSFTLEAAQACNNSWYNWTTTVKNGNVYYKVNGGGGGGGASMIWPRRVDTKEFSSQPIVVGPGGGGASALLDYDSFVNDFLLVQNYSIPPILLGRNELLYFFHVSGHIGDCVEGVCEYYADWPFGVRGNRPIPDSSLFTSGSGGGWRDFIQIEGQQLLRLLDIDGKLLSQPFSTAQGGLDCLAQSITLSSPFSDIFGGYGGGGGGCGSGGGGGGFTGGHVIVNHNIAPGGGGEYSLINYPDLPLQDVLSISRSKKSDGYVEIVASNCGCAGECVVYTEERQFECQCPNGTHLAPDLSDCFQEENLVVTVGDLKDLNGGLNFREITLNSSVQLLSLNTAVTVEPNRVSKRQVGAEPEAGMCVLVLQGEEDSETVLVSNVVSGSGTFDSLSIISLDSDDGTMEMSNLLNSSMLVTGMVLLSTGDCRLGDSVIQANISVQDVSAIDTNASVIISILDDLAVSIFRADTTLNMSEEVPVGVIVGSVIGSTLGVTTVIIIIAVALGVAYCCYSKRTRRALLHKASMSLGSHGEALEINTSYERYQVASPSVPTSACDGYATIHVQTGHEEVAVAEVSSPQSNAQFHPLYGIRTPEVDFNAFNRQRLNTTIENWSYPRSQLTYLRELGEGQFGKVLLMQATDIAGYKGTIPVAVKTLTSRDPDVIKKFKEEAELMKKFSHPNILSLLGFNEGREFEDSAPLMILEYMQYGDLHGFLVKSKRVYLNKQSPLNDFHFLIFAYDIARGLEFLSRHKHVHRDIAARNCLVGSGLQIKIADFGLARGIGNKDYYKVAGSAVLPVRWMSPESLLLGKFTTASDVWSYGVLIWEILTFGQQPLPDMNTEEIIEAAQTMKIKHLRPQNSPEDLYQLMCSCHQLHVEDRPSFAEIVEMELFSVVQRRPPLPNVESTEPQS